MASEQRNWLKIFGLGCVVILALLIIAVVAGVFGLRSYLHHQATRNMTPEQVQDMTAFFEEPVEIPLEWRTVEPFPSEVVEAGEKAQTLAARLLEGNEEWSELLRRRQSSQFLNCSDLLETHVRSSIPFRERMPMGGSVRIGISRLSISGTSSCLRFDYSPDRYCGR